MNTGKAGMSNHTAALGRARDSVRNAQQILESLGDRYWLDEPPEPLYLQLAEEKLSTAFARAVIEATGISAIMDELKDMLRELFRTKNDLTFPVSATGSAGMETCFVNLLEPGDEAMVCVNGVFGNRMSDIVERCSAKLTRVEAPWGEPIDPAAVKTP
ncbi:hypothetical protein LCGC14_2751990 [marine sediment metagenome]|uniref:Aminotransferase class V domain-containing protein n=1 Tax=marine sediment metagenome TaxID=412755 RepID=A0A0F9BA40_9ZZZZ